MDHQNEECVLAFIVSIFNCCKTYGTRSLKCNRCIPSKQNVIVIVKYVIVVIATATISATGTAVYVHHQGEKELIWGKRLICKWYFHV